MERSHQFKSGEVTHQTSHNVQFTACRQHSSQVEISLGNSCLYI